MTEAETQSASASPEHLENPEFISSIDIRHGPRELLVPYFLDLDADLFRRGVRVELAPASALLAVNEANRDSWLPLFPAFRTEYCPDLDQHAFALLGRDADGTVIATQAVRRYDFTGTSFKAEIESLRLLYGDRIPPAQRGERWMAMAPTASFFTGVHGFTGAVWYHPRARGRGIAGRLPPLGRAVALALWGIDGTITLMSQKNIDARLHLRSGQRNFEPGIHARGSTHGDVDYTLCWMSRSDILTAIAERLAAKPDRAHVGARDAKEARGG